MPAVLAGLVVGRLGLQTTFETFGSVVVGIALLVAVEAWRTRPRRSGRTPSRRTPSDTTPTNKTKEDFQ